MDEETASLLAVKRSLTGRRWIARAGDDRLALALSQTRGLPEVLGRVLAARGVTLGTVDSFLAPTLRTLMPDPSRFTDMDAAADRLAWAVRRGETVALFCDYDVDGATSAALMARFLRAVGCTPRLYVPDRLTEGYGPNIPALLRLRDEGVDLVVTLDCGTVSFEPLRAAQTAGLDIVVIDHHAAESELPPAIAVVNPNRPDDRSGEGALCAAGVTFVTVVAINRALRAAGWYVGRPEPDLMSWLDLVALGTVCDVVPLTGLNRALVAQGLKVMARRGNPGLAALADISKLDQKPDAYHAGFVLGPRLNAGGRVGSGGLSLQLLATDDPLEALDLARRLEGHNGERKTIEVRVLAEAMAQVGERPAGTPILAAGHTWHPGVIGIVAARLVSRHQRPACVVSLTDGQGKGSGRSVPGFDLGASIIAARKAGLLIAGGGHPMAAGFTVAEAKLADFDQFLAERFAAAPLVAPVPTLEFDGTLTVTAANSQLVGQLEQVAPFGPGNPEPRFALPDAQVVRADVVGGSHVRCILSGPEGGRLKAIAFRNADTDLGRALLAGGRRPVHLAGTLRLDSWQGRQDVQLLLEDAALPGVAA